MASRNQSDRILHFQIHKVNAPKEDEAPYKFYCTDVAVPWEAFGFGPKAFSSKKGGKALRVWRR